MIRALCELNDKLAASVPDYPRFGQSRIDNADTMLCLSIEGEVEKMISLIHEDSDGNGNRRTRAAFRLVPFQHTRSSGISPYFLCDTAEYILGIIPKTGEIDRRKFEASAELHRKILGSLSTPCARGILAFFSSWDPAAAFGNPHISSYRQSFKGRILFRIGEMDALDDAEIWRCWYGYFNGTLGEPERCSILGQDLPMARLHSKIRNIHGGSAIGSSLVSFNNPAFESYGMEGNENARISEQAAFAYSTALNYLLSDRNSRFRIGGSTFVCWADSGDEAYSGFFLDLLDAGSSRMDADKLRSMMARIGKGQLIEFDEWNLDPDSDFHILGMSPNNGRLAVTYFCHAAFGSILENIVRHYSGLAIINLDFPAWPYRILAELILPGKDEKSIPDWLSADFLASIINGSRYPAALYSGILGRIAADRKINAVRAAMIKAFLLRNSSNGRIKEVALMELNDRSDYQPYVLGRLFAVLERIQKAANRPKNREKEDEARTSSTIKDRFFDSACSTPAVAFPSIMLLANKHLKKLERDEKGIGLSVYFTNLIDGIVSLLHETFPAHLTLEEQGAFILGYYHQNHAMNKKEDKEDEDN